MIKTYKWLKIATISSLLLGGVSVVYYMTRPCTDFSIVDYNEKRDNADVHNLIDDNWYWLVARDDFSVDFMLKKRAPNNREKRYFGKLVLKVLRVKGQFAGFLAYYKKSFLVGQIFFVVVKDSFRGHGYGYELVNYAVHALARMGVEQVQLLTRITNIHAQAVYKRAGFNEIYRDNGYVYFAKPVR